MSSIKEQGDLFWMLTHQETQSGILTSFSVFQSDRLQPIAICCNTLTRHISSCFTDTHFNVARDIGSRCLARTSSMYHPHVVVVVLILFDPPLCTLHRLSHLPFNSPDLHVHLPCGLVR